jgi:hypothetical protein
MPPLGSLPAAACRHEVTIMATPSATGTFSPTSRGSSERSAIQCRGNNTASEPTTVAAAEQA